MDSSTQSVMLSNFAAVITYFAHLCDTSLRAERFNLYGSVHFLRTPQLPYGIRMDGA